MSVVPPIPIPKDHISNDRAARVVRVGAAAAVAVASLQTALHVINRAWWRSEQLDADVDGNVLTWFTASALLLCAAGALFLAFTGGRHLRLVLLSATLALFAIDEVIALHERVSLNATAVLGVDHNFARALWPLLYLPLLAFSFVALWQVAHDATQATLAIRVGLSALVAAVGAEMVWSSWHLSEGEVGDWPDTVEVALEEGLELAGWILIASGLWAAAVASGAPFPRSVRLRRRPARVADPSA